MTTIAGTGTDVTVYLTLPFRLGVPLFCLSIAFDRAVYCIFSVILLGNFVPYILILRRLVENDWKNLFRSL